MGLKYNRETFNQMLRGHGNITTVLLDAYQGAQSRHTFFCLKCEHKWETTATSVEQATKKNGTTGCLHCGREAQIKATKLTALEIAKRLKGRDIECLSSFETVHEKVNWRCLACNYRWSATPGSVLGSKRSGCTHCNRNSANTKRRFDHQKILRQIHERNPDIILLEEYKGDATPILASCIACGNEWRAAPTHLKRDTGCPECAKHAAGGDGITHILNGTIRCQNGPTQVYVVEMKNFPEYLKIGLSNHLARRGCESTGQYGEALSLWHFETRLEAFAVEAVALEGTLSFYEKPLELRRKGWDGITELRKIDPNRLIEFMQQLVDECCEIGPLPLILKYLNLTSLSRADLERLHSSGGYVHRGLSTPVRGRRHGP